MLLACRDMADTKTLKRTPDRSRTQVDGFDKTTVRRATKFLSYVLRHGPDTIGVDMDGEGWVVVDQLVEASQGSRKLTRPLLAEILAADDKRRFDLSDDEHMIRANHGHSVPVDLGLTPSQPPDRLYHSTSMHKLRAILAKGLLPLGRTHVHLTAELDAAAAIRGRLPDRRVLMIDSAAMTANGHRFQLSASGIWLTGPVPPKYLTMAD